VSNTSVLGVSVLSAVMPLGVQAAFGASDEDLVSALPKSRITLADGVRQVARSGGQPLSAKFELDDDHKLSLSVYAVKKQPQVNPASDSPSDVLVELSGSPEAGEWTPETEVFKDAEHVVVPRNSSH
jgi:hypothetical protein